jgi:uncharacterized RDD family membrane protein YckC
VTQPPPPPPLPSYPTPAGPYHPPGYPTSWRPPPPAPTAPNGQRLASFSDRLLAYLIDAGVLVGAVLVLAIPVFIFFFVAVTPDLFEFEPDGTAADPDFFEFFVPFLLLEAAIVAISMVVSYVYYVEMLFRSGQTLGKKAMKIKIVPLDPAATLTRRVAAKRWLVAYLAAAFVPGLNYLDGLWQLWDKPYQQCLHDKFARTVVVKVPT